MKSLFLLLTILTINNSKIYSAEVFISNNDAKVYNTSTYSLIENNASEAIIVRRKGELKYSELKVYWKKFIKNLDKKRQNPDQVILDNKKSLA